MKKLRKEQEAAVKALMQEMMADRDAGKSIHENIREQLQKRVDGVDADRVMAGLEKGICNFHENLHKAEEQGLDVLAESSLDEMLEKRNEEEQRALLADLLTALAEASGHPVPGAFAETGELGELKAAVKEYICEYSVLHLDCEASERLLEELGAEQMELLREAQEEENLERYTAAAMYILKVTGTQEEIPADMSEHEIGVAAAASVCSQQTIRSGLLGRIDWEKVKARLKLIAGVAVLAVLTAVSAKLAVVTGALVFYFVQAVVGLGVIGTIAAAAFGAAAAFNFVKSMLSAGKKIGETTGVNEKLAQGSARLGAWIENTVKPAAQAFWEKIKTLFAARTASQNTQRHTQAHTAAEEKADEAAPVRA